jgi:hypothetical protein
VEQEIMRNSSILLGLMLVILLASPSLAFEGRYRGGGQGYRQDVTIKQRDADSYRVEFVVGTPGCSGYFEGKGRVEGAKLVVRTPADDINGKCTVSILRKGPGLAVTEEDDCNLHGASCEFAGTYHAR